MIETLLPTLSPATLDDIHAEALKRKLTDQPALKNFVRRFDVDKIIKKKYVVDGRVSIDAAGKYVWVGKPEVYTTSTPKVVTLTPPRQDVPVPRAVEPVPTPPPTVVATVVESTPEPSKPVDLEELNKGELAKIASSLKIDTKGMSKGDIIDAINAAQTKGVSA